MAYTSHGHHIPGTYERDHGANRVQKCGGVTKCERCIKESSKILPLKVVGGKDDIPRRNVELVSYSNGKRIVLGEVEVELVLDHNGITTSVKVEPDSSLQVWLGMVTGTTGEKFNGNLEISNLGED